MFDYIRCLYDGMMSEHMPTLPRDEESLEARREEHDAGMTLLAALPEEQQGLFFAYEDALNAQHGLEQARLFRETLALGRMIYGQR